MQTIRVLIFLAFLMCFFASNQAGLRAQDANDAQVKLPFDLYLLTQREYEQAQKELEWIYKYVSDFETGRGKPYVSMLQSSQKAWEDYYLTECDLMTQGFSRSDRYDLGPQFNPMLENMCRTRMIKLRIREIILSMVGEGNAPDELISLLNTGYGAYIHFSFSTDANMVGRVSAVDQNRTQLEINSAAGGDYTEIAQQEKWLYGLGSTPAMRSKRSKDSESRRESSESNWKKYLHANCEYMTSDTVGGSLQSEAISECKWAMTRERIYELLRWYTTAPLDEKTRKALAKYHPSFGMDLEVP